MEGYSGPSNRKAGPESVERRTSRKASSIPVSHSTYVALAIEPVVLLPGPASHVPSRGLAIQPEPAPDELAAIAAVMAAAVHTADAQAQIELIPKWRQAARNYNDDYDGLRAARRARI